MPKKKESKTLRKEQIDRKILFYRFNPGGKPGLKPLNFDPTATLDHIDTLNFDENGRYLVDLNGDAFVCWPGPPGPPWRFIFGKSRRYNLPQQELGGKRKPLGLPATAGLCEVSHMIWFPGNILGVERNFYSGTPANLHSYLSKKADGIYSGEGFELLIKRQALEELQKLEEIRLLHIKVQRSYSDLIAVADADLANTFNAQMDALLADEIEVILKVRRGTKHGLAERLRGGLAKIARKRDLPEKVETLIAKGPTLDNGRMKEVDFLSDELVVTKPMLRADPRSRAVRSESAFQEIQNAFAEVESLLMEAAGVQV